MNYPRLLTILFTLSFTTISPYTIFAADTPSIAMDTMSHDFGIVKKGTVVKHDFYFINEGKSVLKIRDFYLSWPDATTISVSSAEIEPGENGSFTVTMDSTNFDGKIHRTFGIETNDPDNEDIILTIYLNVTE